VGLPQERVELIIVRQCPKDPRSVRRNRDIPIIPLNRLREQGSGESDDGQFILIQFLPHSRVNLPLETKKEKTMYWMQVNENLTLVKREAKDFPQVRIVEDCGYVILIGEERVLANIVSRGILTISDQGEGEPKFTMG
jgi:hypothetical protein